jgi:hypothetical protein
MPFECVNLIRQHYVVPGNSLFNKFKNKTEIGSASKEGQHSLNSFSRRAECMLDDHKHQLRQDMKSVNF